jgi:hypothetical protein
MLAAVVLVAQVAVAQPNPCADQLSALCRISPLFCPSAYPSNLVPGTNGIPCWPERDPVSVSTMAHPAAPTVTVAPRGGSERAATGRSAVAARPLTARSFFSAAAKLFHLSD